MHVAVETVVLGRDGEKPEDAVREGGIGVGLRSVKEAGPDLVRVGEVPCILQWLARLVEATVEYEVIFTVEELALNTSFRDVVLTHFRADKFPS
jgi:hypothetical protein